LARSRGVARGDFVLVGGEGGQHFALLALRHLCEVQRPTEFGCDLVEFGRRDPQVAMGLLKAERRRAGFGSRELERPARHVADPQGPLELEAGQPCQVLGVPFPQPGVFRLLTDDRVFYDGVAEVIDHRCDGEDAAEPVIQALVSLGLLGLRVSAISPRQSRRRGAQRQPRDHSSPAHGSRASLCHWVPPYLGV
jgi:hypothetical protein